MKRLLLILLFLPLFTHAQSWQWLKGAQNGESHGVAVAADVNGNVYGAGDYYGIGHCDTFSFSSWGSNPGLISSGLIKYDSVGNIRWFILSSNGSSPVGVATDLFGNVYMMGLYQNSITFGGYTLNAPSSDTQYYYIAKADSSGSIEWLKSVGNVQLYGGNWGINSIAIDDCGSIYIACGITNHATIGSLTVSNAGPSIESIVVAKFDSSGSVEWAKSFGGTGPDWVNNIAVTHSGNIYVAGSFKSDSLIFGSTILTDTNISVFGLGNKAWCSFIVKLDNTGKPIWARDNTGSADCELYGLAVDQSENAYITGFYDHESSNYSGDIWFNTLPLPPAPYMRESGFVVKYDYSGSVSWGKYMRGANGLRMITDPCMNIWVYGALDNGTDTIDSHVLSPPYISPSSFPAGWNVATFLAGWNSSGTFISVNPLATGAEDYMATNVTCDWNGNLYITGADEIDTFILAADSMYNYPYGTAGYLGHPLNMFIAKYNPNLGCLRNHNRPSCIVEVQNVIKNDEQQVSLMPNPSTTSITITSVTPITTLSISNFLGQSVYISQPNAKEAQVDVSTLPAGMYLVRINNTDVRKFLKE